MSRFVVIDDTDPSIQYSGDESGPWFQVSNTQINTGSYGPPFQNTLHGVNVTASFSFDFSGSAVIVYGSSITTNASGTQDPTWECFIDNASIGWFISSDNDVNSLGSQNNWPLCGAHFQDGPHSLTVNANVLKQMFWFDQIQYTPSASVSLNQSVLRIDSNDPAIQYSPAGVWQMFNGNIFEGFPGNEGNVSIAGTNGATLTYQFSGTSIAFYGSDSTALLNNTVASAIYTIDNQDSNNFTVPYPPGGITNFNQNLFKTPQLSPGQHNLVIEYFGSPATVPIGFSYFIQENGTSSTSSNAPTSTFTSIPSGSSSNSSPSSSTPAASGNHRTPTDAIIGGVIGGLVLISLLLALFFFNRRRNNRRLQALNEMSSTVPSPDFVNPFTSPSSNPNSTMTFLPQNYNSNGQSFSSQFISSKFSHRRGQPSDPAIMSSLSRPSPNVVNPSTFPSSNPNSTMTFLPENYTSNDQSHQRGQLSDPAASASTGGGGGIPPLTPLRPQFLSPAFTPSGSSPLRALPSTRSEPQTHLDASTRTRVPQDATEPSMQRSPSLLQGLHVGFLVQHDDNGVRIPAEDEVQVVELPPVYSPE